VEDRVELVSVLDDIGLLDVTVLDGGQMDIILTASAYEEADITILHEVPGALALEGLRGVPGPPGINGLQAEASIDLAGWYQLQKEL
jgi:hypothetical protein